MKAIRIQEHGSFDALRYVDIEKPKLHDGQALIRAESISVNFADTMLRKGSYHIRPRLPVIPGFEMSGYVEEVADGLDALTPGQPVIYVGANCYAEYVAGEGASVFPLPENVDMDAAAVMPVIYLTAWHMMHTAAHVRPGQTVLVYAAAGGVGTAVAQLGKLAGVRTIGLTSTEEKAAYAKDQGFDHVVNYKTENVVRRVREITGGRGVDLVLNSVAADSFHQDFRMSAPLGQIIWFGSAAGTPELDLVRKLRVNFGKGVAIRPFHLFMTIAAPYPDLFNDSMRMMIGYLKEGKIRPRIHEKIPLREAWRAHSLLESKAVRGKLLLKVQD